MTADHPALALTGVSVSYSSDTVSAPVLSDITLEVPHGEIVAIVGQSGSGKSTLLRTIAGLHTPHQGDVTIDGVPVSGPPHSLGFVVQDYSASLFPWLTVQGNILLAMNTLSLTRREKKALISEQLAALGLAGAERRYPWQLSGGMAQRVAIARAVIGRPRLLLMDEPFASVDAHTRLDLEDLTLEVVAREHTTLVVVTHDIDEALYLADRVLVIGGQHGTILLDQEVLFDRPRAHVTTRALPEFQELRTKIYRLIGAG